MAIKDLQPRTGKHNLTLVITEKAEPRTFEKFGKEGRVCNAQAKDETGEITLTLWNDDVDAVSVGDKISIENGWVSEWQGQLQLSTGKFGKMTVLEKGVAAPEPAAAPAQPETPKAEGSSVADDVLEEDIF